MPATPRPRRRLVHLWRVRRAEVLLEHQFSTNLAVNDLSRHVLRVLDYLHQLARLADMRTEVRILHELITFFHQSLGWNEFGVALLENASLSEVLAQRSGPRPILPRISAFDPAFGRYEARELRFCDGLANFPVRLLKKGAQLFIGRAATDSLPKFHQSTAFLVVYLCVSAVLLDSPIVTRAIRILAYRIFV